MWSAVKAMGVPAGSTDRPVEAGASANSARNDGARSQRRGERLPDRVLLVVVAGML
jgi:hypothetical protein